MRPDQEGACPGLKRVTQLPPRGDPRAQRRRAYCDGIRTTCCGNPAVLAHAAGGDRRRGTVARPEARPGGLHGRGAAAAPGGATEGEVASGAGVVRAGAARGWKRRFLGMDWLFVESLKPDESYVRRLHPRLWLMDSHNWALFAWESSLRPLPGHERSSLAHLDYHFDAWNDFTSAPDVEHLLRAPGGAACAGLTEGAQLDQVRLVHRAGDPARPRAGPPLLLPGNGPRTGRLRGVAGQLRRPPVLPRAARRFAGRTGGSPSRSTSAWTCSTTRRTRATGATCGRTRTSSA
jgi:hypothetical protein